MKVKVPCFILSILVIVMSFYLGVSEAGGCACPEIYKPECGMDGKTYGNECERNCKKVEKASDGRCEETRGCGCSKENNPQCGKDGKTYRNPCLLKCANVNKRKDGVCP